MRWARYVAGVEEMRNAYKTLVGKPEGKERDHMVDLGADGRIILNKNLKKTGCEDVEWIQLARNSGRLL